MISFAVEPDFDFTGRDFAELYAHGGLSAFQHPVWLAAFYRRLPTAAGVEPLIVTGRFPDGRLALVLPLVRRPGAADAAFGFLGVTDYACPVVLPEALDELAGGESLRAFLRSSSRVGLVRIEPVRDDHRPVWTAVLAARFEPLGYSAHALVLGAPYPLLRRRALGGRKARDLDRKALRLLEHGEVRFERLAADAAAAAIHEAARLRRGRFPGDPLQMPAFAAFYAEVAAAGAASGYASTWRLSAGGRTAAILFGVAWRRTFCYLVLAADYAAFARQSPGFLIFEHTIAAWAAGGGDVFDFTIGDEPFKAMFGSAATPMLRAVAG